MWTTESALVMCRPDPRKLALDRYGSSLVTPHRPSRQYDAVCPMIHHFVSGEQKTDSIILMNCYSVPLLHRRLSWLQPVHATHGDTAATIPVKFEEIWRNISVIRLAIESALGLSGRGATPNLAYNVESFALVSTSTKEPKRWTEHQSGGDMENGCLFG